MTSTTITPEVQDFLAAVRVELEDLDADEQREILDGLEADLTDLVAEHGRGALGDPVLYARELRAAAGLEAAAGPGRRRMTLSEGVHGFLDDVHDRFDALVGASPADLVPVLAWLRPLWWIARAWVAVQLIDAARGVYRPHVIPDLDGLGAVGLLAAVVGSVLVGVGRLWPGGRHGLASRLALLVLNAVAVAALALVVPAVADGGSASFDRGYGAGFRDGVRGASEGNEPKAGLYANGIWVSNIYPYDAQGRPLVGVQLFDQTGKPIKVVTQAEYEPCDATGPNCPEGFPVDNDGNQLQRVYYPWSNGATQLLNVFPIPSRLQVDEGPSATAFTETTPPTVGAFPLASVPKVSLPGITPGRQHTP